MVLSNLVNNARLRIKHARCEELHVVVCTVASVFVQSKYISDQQFPGYFWVGTTAVNNEETPVHKVMLQILELLLLSTLYCSYQPRFIDT